MLQKLIVTVVHLFLSAVLWAQVSLQTGSAEQSFPLINYADSKSGLTLGIGAQYSSGNGLLVNGVASSLGTGWNLAAGGAITRIQIGEPDDQPEFDTMVTVDPLPYPTPAYTGPEAPRRYPNGFLYNPNIGCPKGLNAYPVFREKYTIYKQKNSIAADLTQDRFAFQFNGHSGSFIIGRDRKVTTLGDSRLKIEFSQQDMPGIRTTIDAFTITTEDGIKYTFRTRVLSEVLRYKLAEKKSDGTFKVKEGLPSEEPMAVNRYYGFPLEQGEHRRYIVSAWCLTEMENTNNGAKISFEYDQVYEQYTASKHIAHQRLLDKSLEFLDAGTYYNILSKPSAALEYSSNIEKLSKIGAGSTMLVYVRSHTIGQQLKRIVLPANGVVDFLYNTRPRADLAKLDNLPQPGALAKIEYRQSGNLVRGYEFTHGYFFYNTVKSFSEEFTSFQKKFTRLCLLAIKKIGNGEDNATEPPYHFTYYTGTTDNPDDIVPPHHFLAQDHWGYYNGANSGLSLTEDHDFLDDETNQYFKTALYNYHQPKEGYAANGLLKTVTYPTGGTLEYRYAQKKEVYTNEQFSTIEGFIGGVAVSQTTQHDGEDQQKDIVTDYAYVKANDGTPTNDGTSSHWGYERPMYTSLNYNVYDERWDGKAYKYPGIEYPEMAVSSASVSVPWGKIIAQTGVNMAVQAGIQQVIGKAAMKSYNLAMVILSIYQFVEAMEQKFPTYRFVLSNTNRVLTNSVGGMYARVEVRTSSPQGYNGKTVYDFTSKMDYPLLEPNFEWPYIDRQRAAAWQYGLPKKVTVYDAADKVISEITNQYQPVVEKIADASNVNCNCDSKAQVSIRSDNWMSTTGYFPLSETSAQASMNMLLNGGNPTPYYYYTGRMDLQSVQQRSFKNEQLYFSGSTKIINDPASLLQKGKVVQKDVNSTLMQVSYYPKDYDLSGAIAMMKTNNAIHTPIATETWKVQNDISVLLPQKLYLVDAAITEYKVFTFEGKQQVRPWKTYALKTKEPLAQSVIGMQSRSVLVRHPEYFKVTSEMGYDDKGNLVQTVSDAQTVSYINDYQGRLVTATVVNAPADRIAYTSFEADGQGAWNYDPAAIVAGGLTGQKSYQVHPGSTITYSRPLGSSGPYTITYWFKGTGTITAEGGRTLLYQRADGWALYQHTITSSATILSEATGQIDEVRLHPKNAVMSTVAFKDGIGKVTECDANNRLLYYEYDALGRLKLIRDQNLNVIKTYEYNYKQ